MKSHKKTSKWNVPMLSFPRSFLKLRPLLVYLIFEFLKNFIMGIMFAAGRGGGGRGEFCIQEQYSPGEIRGGVFLV